MPTYHVTSANFTLTHGQKCALAESISHAHARHTGAPAYFAQIFFRSANPESHFIGGKVNNSNHLFVHGLVRAGRSPQVKASLIEQIISDSSRILEFSRSDIWVYVQDLYPGDMAEFGRTLPEPGKEAEWRRGMSEKKVEQLTRAGVDM